MKNILPRFVLFVLTFFLTLSLAQPVLSASPNPSVAASLAPSPAGSATPAPATGGSDVGAWVADPEVTFAGKVAARSADSLNWVISNYHWADFKNDATNVNEKNPFNPIWKTIRLIVYSFLTLFILAGAFLIIVTRGESLSIQKFVPRFVLVLILVTLSFSLVQFLYQVIDLIQGFFLHRPNSSNPNEFISAQDLLNVAFNYQDFEGYRRIGTTSPFQFDESAFIHLILVKLTAATYYVMFIVLILRKVILWFFIIVSPVFPLLILFYPLKNSAKIWVGEFFRWLLYAPLFSIFLYGLVALWQIYIPINTKLPCDKPVTEQLKAEYGYKYPTSINILLGGPCQKLSSSNVSGVDSFNNLNNSDSFIQYVVALLMLWMVILMPFILLKIFLDYFNNFSLKDNGIAKYLYNKPNPSPARGEDLSKALSQARPMLNLKPPPPPIPPISPTGFGSAGLARQLPREAFQNRDISTTKPVFVGNYQTQQNIKQVLDMTQIKIPTIRDISRIESGLISKTSVHNQEVSRVTETLARISGTSQIMTPAEKSQFGEMLQKLKIQAVEGNQAAKAVVNATKKPEEVQISEDNKLQTVNVEDYEEVKKTWIENYQKLEPPEGTNGQILSRKDWITQDQNQIPKVIDLLLSADPLENNQGKQMVSKILPFLLLGGFSKAEIVTYLKAKLEAAKQVLSEVQNEEQDEDNKVFVENKNQQESKSMYETVQIPEEGNNEPVEKNNLGEAPVQLFTPTNQNEPEENIKIAHEDYTLGDKKSDN